MALKQANALPVSNIADLATIREAIANVNAKLSGSKAEGTTQESR
jgi:hypothetical protein